MDNQKIITNLECKSAGDFGRMNVFHYRIFHAFEKFSSVIVLTEITIVKTDSAHWSLVHKIAETDPAIATLYSDKIALLPVLSMTGKYVIYAL